MPYRHYIAYYNKYIHNKTADQRKEHKSIFINYVILSIMAAIGVGYFSGLIVNTADGDVVASSELGILLTLGFLKKETRNILISTFRATGKVTLFLAKIVFEEYCSKAGKARVYVMSSVERYLIQLVIKECLEEELKLYLKNKDLK